MKTKRNKELLKEKYGTEQVFVVPYHFTQEIPNGLSYGSDVSDIDLDKGKYLYRYDVEGDMSFIQIIPTVVISDASEEKYFVTRRIGGEERLKDKLSIIIGGHINPPDGYRIRMLFNCMNREIGEETNLYDINRNDSKMVDIKSAYPEWYVRDLTSNTPDHLGYIYRLKLSNNGVRKLKVKETNNLEGMWMTKDQLMNNYAKFESWGQMIIAEILVDNASKKGC